VEGRVVSVAETSLAGHWGELVSASLLGVERRPAPAPMAGPLDDLVAARARSDEAERVLDDVAAISAMRRAGVRPGPGAAPLVPAPEDPRPTCRPAAVDRLYDLLEQWPALVDPWLAGVAHGGWRLPPDVAVELLRRWRAEPRRRATVIELTGALAGWLVALFPDELASRLAERPGRAASRSASASPAASPAPDAANGPAIPPDLVPLLDLDGPALAGALAQGMRDGAFGVRHRPGLVELLLHTAPENLAPVGDALERAATNPETMGLAISLADLARVRLGMIEELTP
jgi:hypothetical protein